MNACVDNDLPACIEQDRDGIFDKPAISYRVEEHARYFEAFNDALDLQDVTLVLHPCTASPTSFRLLAHRPTCGRWRRPITLGCSTPNCPSCSSGPGRGADLPDSCCVASEPAQGLYHRPARARSALRARRPCRPHRPADRPVATVSPPVRTRRCMNGRRTRPGLEGGVHDSPCAISLSVATPRRVRRSPPQRVLASRRPREADATVRSAPRSSPPRRGGRSPFR